MRLILVVVGIAYNDNFVRPHKKYSGDRPRPTRENGPDPIF